MAMLRQIETRTSEGLGRNSVRCRSRDASSRTRDVREQPPRPRVDDPAHVSIVRATERAGERVGSRRGDQTPKGPRRSSDSGTGPRTVRHVTLQPSGRSLSTAAGCRGLDPRKAAGDTGAETRRARASRATPDSVLASAAANRLAAVPDLPAPWRPFAPSAAPSTRRRETRRDLRLSELPHLLSDLADGLLLKLPDALARQVVLVADLLQRQLVLVVEAEAPADDARFDGREGVEQTLDLRDPARRREIVVGRERVVLHQEVDEAATILVPDGSIERKRSVGVQLAHLVELVLRDAGLLLQLLRRRLLTGPRDQRLR